MTTRVNKDTLCTRLNVESFDTTILAKTLCRIPDLGSKCWIAGGAVRRTVQGVSLDSDIDFFFKEADAVKDWEEEAKAKGASLVSENDKNKIYILPTKIVEMDNRKVYLPQIKLQAINFQYFESPEAVIDSFDFTICQTPR